jgi:hypothetical protein
MSHVERPQIKGFYFEGFSSYPFNLYKNGMGEGGRLVVYNYDNQEEHSIELSHDQVLEFLKNVVNMPRHLELDGDAEYDGTWLSGTLEEATRKYNVMIAANNAAVQNAAGPLPPPAVDAAAGPAVDADGAAEGGKRRHRKKRKSQKKRKSHKRSKKTRHRRSRR